MNRFVVLEGPDGVGKSTLADAIEYMMQGSTLRRACGPPRPEDGESVFQMYCRYIDQAIIDLRHSNLIYDRLHVGELAYGLGIRGDSKLTLSEARFIDMKLRAAGAMMVHCTLSEDALISRLIKRDRGAPDPKSGASLKHAPLLRWSYMAYCGGGLSGAWNTIEMTSYPNISAEYIDRLSGGLATLRHRGYGWVGTKGSTFVHAVSDIEAAVNLVGMLSSVENVAVCFDPSDENLAAIPANAMVVAHGYDVQKLWASRGMMTVEVPW